MKTVRGPFANFRTNVGVPGGERIVFENYIATMPDHVADILCQRLPQHYSVISQFIPSEVQSLLVIRDMGLGDVLLTTPLIRELKSSGIAEIDFATFDRYTCLLEGNPHIRNVLKIEEYGGTLPTTDYEAVIDLRMNVEHAENASVFKNRAVAFCSVAEVEIDVKTEIERLHLDYYPRQTEIDGARRTLEHRGFDLSTGKTVSVVWRASVRNRTWQEHKIRGVINDLIANGYQVIVLDHEQQSLGDIVGSGSLYDGTGKHSIRGTAALIKCSDVVLTPDTGLFHLASALDKPVVTYFGAFPIEERMSHSKVLNVIRKDLCGLYPCRKYGCMNFDQATGTSKCINSDTGVILAALQKMAPPKPALQKAC